MANWFCSVFNVVCVCRKRLSSPRCIFIPISQCFGTSLLRQKYTFVGITRFRRIGTPIIPNDHYSDIPIFRQLFGSVLIVASEQWCSQYSDITLFCTCYITISCFSWTNTQKKRKPKKKKRLGIPLRQGVEKSEGPSAPSTNYSNSPLYRHIIIPTNCRRVL